MIGNVLHGMACGSLVAVLFTTKAEWAIAYALCSLALAVLSIGCRFLR